MAINIALIFAASFKHSLWVFVRRFGAFAFFPLGLLDMSVVPAPGSFDALLIVLTAAHHELWWYYALMATAGSVCGALPSFQIGRKGGEEALEKKLGARRSKKIFSAFQRWGFWSMFIGAIAPPPMPASAFILAAGALKYPLPRFLFAWTFGRLLRFGLVAWVTMRYGKHIFHWLRGYYQPALWTFGVFGVAAGAVALWFYIRERRRSPDRPEQPQRRAA
jgi:membrane protein YqaA with SNARE-associated domain